MNKTSLGAPITTTVAALSDQGLLQRVKELTAIEQYVEGVVIDHLRELERRQLYLTLGFSSMYDYAVRELGYSTGAAWRRLKAMRLCEEVPGARGRLLEGTLTLDAAAQLQHAFEQQERKANRSTTPDTDTQADAGSATSVMAPGAPTAVAPGGSAPDVVARDAGPAGSEGAFSGLVPDAPVRAPERPAAAPVLDAAERESLVAQAAGKSTRQVKEMLAKVHPDLARTADRMRPLGAGRWELKAVIDDDCQVGLEQLKGLLSHVDPQMTLGQLLGRVVREALDRRDPSRPPRGRGRRRRTPDVTGQTSAPKNSGRAGRRYGAADRPAGSFRDFGAERTGGRRPAPRYGCKAAGSGHPDRRSHGGDFGAEGGCGGAADRAAGGRGGFAGEGSGRGPARGGRRNRHFGAEGGCGGATARATGAPQLPRRRRRMEQHSLGKCARLRSAA